MSEEQELIDYYKSVRQNMDSWEKIKFIQEIFYELQEQGIKLPMGDYNEVDRYLNEITNKIYSHTNLIISDMITSLIKEQ